MQVGDAEEIERLMCDDIASPVDLDDPSTLGSLRPVYEIVGSRGGRGGASEYSPLDSVSIPVDNAWTEIDFVGSTELDREVWRFHMVREGGVWKVCSVEPRPDAPLPPAGVGTVNRLTVRTLASFDSQSPEQVRRILLGEHLASRA